MAGRFKIRTRTNAAMRDAMVGRLREAQQRTAKAFSGNILEHAKSKIPTGGWYDIYRESLHYFASDDGLQWAVAGLWPQELTKFPANETLLLLESQSDEDAVGMVFQARNPWPIDMIPAITQPIRNQVTARPASRTDVETRRADLRSDWATFVADLGDAGATVIPNQLPVISGRTYADIVYMSTALEHGLAGLRRIPHWVSAFREAQSSAGAWSANVHPEVQAIIDGEAVFDADAEKMPKDLKDAMP